MTRVYTPDDVSSILAKITGTRGYAGGAQYNVLVAAMEELSGTSCRFRVVNQAAIMMNAGTLTEEQFVAIATLAWCGNGE
jgi:hypothetical protein